MKWAIMAVTCAAIASVSWLSTRPTGPKTVPPTAVPSTTPTPSATLTDGVPTQLIGRWKGNGQGPHGTQELEVDLVQGTRGQAVGDSGVGSFTCRFSVILDGTEPNAILFTERLKSGSGCLGSSGRLSLHGQNLRYSALTDSGDPVVGELQRG